MFSNAHMTFMAGAVVEDRVLIGRKLVPKIGILKNPTIITI